MTIQEFYDAVGGDYNGTLSRMLKEDRVKKYILRFASVTEFADMKAAIAVSDWKNAFLHIHTLKGNALNLGLSRLAASGSALCETMRNGPPQVDITDLTAQVERDLNEVLDTIPLITN